MHLEFGGQFRNDSNRRLALAALRVGRNPFQIERAISNSPPATR